MLLRTSSSSQFRRGVYRKQIRVTPRNPSQPKSSRPRSTPCPMLTRATRKQQLAGVRIRRRVNSGRASPQQGPPIISDPRSTFSLQELPPQDIASRRGGIPQVIKRGKKEKNSSSQRQDDPVPINAKLAERPLQSVGAHLRQQPTRRIHAQLQAPSAPRLTWWLSCGWAEQPACGLKPARRPRRSGHVPKITQVVPPHIPHPRRPSFRNFLEFLLPSAPSCPI